MNSITRMERGKLCPLSRGPGSRTFYRLQVWHEGKNSTRYVPLDEVPALKEALAQHQRFQNLASEFAELTITMTRQATAEDSKKKDQAKHDIKDERFTETNNFLIALRKKCQEGPAPDFAWVEQTLLEAIREDGRRVLEEIIKELPEPEFQRQPGQRAYESRPCSVLSTFGWVRYERCYYQAGGESGVCPKDEALGIINGCTLMAARMLCRTAARLPYMEAADELLHLAGLTVESTFIARLVQPVGAKGKPLLERLSLKTPEKAQTFYTMADGTGAPMAKEALEGRKGKGPEGKATTREIKLAAFFTQTTTDEEGHPIRDPATTTYLGTFAGSDEFGARMKQAALARGIGLFVRQAFLGDGAAWLWTIAALYFPNALQILDYWHASEHVGKLAKLAFAEPGSATNMAVRWKALMYDSELDIMMAEARAEITEATKEGMEKILNYFQNNRSRMDYKRYREEGYFIGSGVVESGCKKVIGGRIKQPGMFWKEPGGEAVTVLRCALLSGDAWNQFWNMFAQLPKAA